MYARNNMGHRRATIPDEKETFEATHYFISSSLFPIIQNNSHLESLPCFRKDFNSLEDLVVNPIAVGNFAFLFNCTQVGRTSNSMTVLA